MNKLQIYKASAGSGKTYLLALTYLKSAFKSPDNFTKILAVTFTNKAAEEMKTRIIDKLNELIQKGKEASYYSEIYKEINASGEDELIKKAKTVRDQILHNYSAFQVNTIDSFVQRVVRAFSYEMNLNSTYDVELDRGKVLDELTEMLYETISDNKELQKWLIEYANSKTDESKNWNFRKDIKKLAEELFKERFQVLYHSENKTFDKKELSDFLSKLYKIKNTFETKMSDFAKHFSQILNEKGIDYKNFGGKFKTISNHFLTKIKIKKEYDGFTQTLIKATEGFENWYAKSASPELVETIQSVYDDLLKIINDYFNYFETEHENYYTSQQIINNFRSFGIINDLAGLLPEYRRKNNVLFISDTTYLLKEIIGNNDAPFIYEKIGNRFKHILIDEFQDTSGFQWENFKPLILNSLSEGYGNLIVGDIKQSIYRWRDGNWKLLFSQVKKDIGENFVSDHTIKENWRSRENIITFNNAVFKLIPQILQNQYNNSLEDIKNTDDKAFLINENYNKIITDAYAGNFQKPGSTENQTGGEIKIIFLKKETYNEQLAVQFPDIIDNLLSEKQAKDIGILVRTNKQAREVFQILTQYQNDAPERKKYKIISGDALFTENSSAVRILISAMKYIYNPQDTVNLAQLIFEYRNLTSETVDFNTVFLSLKNEEYKKILPANFFNETNLFLQKELFELSEQLISIFNLADKTKEFAYIKSFQNTITEFTKKKYSDISEFLDWWEEKGKFTAVQISDKTDAVTIMTIHKAKGLSFDTVLMPFTNFDIDHNYVNTPILWAKTDVKPFNKFEYLPVKYSKRLAQTKFRKDYFDELLYSYTDAVNLLYVAFTRAENEFYAFTLYNEPKKTSKKASSFKNTGEILYHIISQNINIETGEEGSSFNFGLYYNSDTKIFELSENHITEPKEKEEIMISEFAEKMYPNNQRPDKLKIRYNSEEFLIESIPEIEGKVNYGKLMHSIFQNIITINDIDTAVMKQHSEGMLSSAETELFKNNIREMLTDEKVKSWFDGSYEVINEDAILTVKGDIRIPDRVLISEKELIVIDFKFGKHKEEYKKQILEYKELLEDVYKLPVRSYLYYPEKKQIIRVTGSE